MSTSPPRARTPSRPADHHVVVIGASMAGLAVAGVLASRVRTITLIERDLLADHDGRRDHVDPTGPTLRSRPSVPHGRHAHALLAAGRDALDRIFPGVVAEVEAAGGLRVDGAANNIWYQVGGRRVRYASDVDGISVSRPLLERTVRDRVRSLPNVAIVDQATVRRLRFADDGRSVVGVTIRRGDDDIDLPADLVVDAGGRNAPLLDQLTEAGYPAIPVDRVSVDLAYASRIVARRPGDLGGAEYLVAMSSPPYGRGGIVLPIEGDRWIVTLNGSHGDRPPTDADAFEAFARTVPVPELAELIARHPVDGATTHRFPASQRRRVEKVRHHPAGYVLLGDAVCSFNPAYGQGMTSAVLQAEGLGRAVDRYGVTATKLPRAAYRTIAKVVDNPWRIAVGTDFAHPLTTGAKPPGTDLLNRYMKVVLRACLVSPSINERMVRVQNLLEPPASLLRPDVAVRAVLAARRASAAEVVASSSPAPTEGDSMRRALAAADVHRASR
jgi:2-polyprenyl-6-methoxyphenol hydroxylase-like FAD-dependent oxidoreductase